MVTSHIIVTSQVAFPEVGQLSLSSLRSESDPTQIGRCCENTNSPHWLHLTTQMYFLQDLTMDKYTRNLHPPTTLADHKIICRRFLASATCLHLYNVYNNGRWHPSMFLTHWPSRSFNVKVTKAPISSHKENIYRNVSKFANAVWKLSCTNARGD